MHDLPLSVLNGGDGSIGLSFVLLATSGVQEACNICTCQLWVRL